MDNVIYWINLYPVDNAIGFPNTYPLKSDLSSGECNPTFEQQEPADYTNYVDTNIYLILKNSLSRGHSLSNYVIIYLYNLFHFYEAAMNRMCISPRTGDESYETFIKVKYNPASSFCTVALHVTFFY